MLNLLSFDPPRKSHDDDINASHASFPQCLPCLTQWSLVIKSYRPLIRPPGWLYLLPPLHESIHELRKFDEGYHVLLLTPDPVGDLLGSQFCRQILFFTIEIQLQSRISRNKNLLLLADCFSRTRQTPLPSLAKLFPLQCHVGSLSLGQATHVSLHHFWVCWKA